MGRHEGLSTGTSHHADSAKAQVADTIEHQRELTRTTGEQLITRRSRVQIPPPLRKNERTNQEARPHGRATCCSGTWWSARGGRSLAPTVFDARPAAADVGSPWLGAYFGDMRTSGARGCTVT